jgi:hypothetical protein
MNTTVLTCIIQVQDTETIIERRIVIFYLLLISSLDDKDDAIEDEVFDDEERDRFWSRRKCLVSCIIILRESFD